MPTTKQVELIDKKKFVKAALDENSETFVMYVAALEVPLSGMTIHPSRVSQIFDSNPVEIAALKQNEAPTKAPAKYPVFLDVFSEKEALVLPERTNLNEHAIKLEDDKQPPYGPIYSLSPVELETLKAYIKTHLKTRFLRPFKSPIRVFILFDKKPNSSLCLYVDYWDWNNLTIKNQYPLPFISELLDRWGRAKQFT